MVAMANLHLPEKAVRQQIAGAIDVVIQVSRLSDGARKVMTIAELVGMEGDVITMQDIFSFERRGVDAEGHVVGMFRPTGIRPRFAAPLQSWGRSEEHTSELQSRSDLVCRLLLEKKKQLARSGQPLLVSQVRSF